MRVAVLGDIHANIRALRAALKIVDSGGYDQLVMLGDLLTYGVDVADTLELVGERIAHGHTTLLRGNHDALYRDLLLGKCAYHSQLQVWVKESVDWTLERLPIGAWNELFFEDDLKIQRCLFSHANPFGPEKWQYLNSAPEHASAAEALLAKGMHVGVFGHTHRAKWYRHLGNHGGFEPNQFGDLDYSAAHILNAGSIGQPRDNANQVAAVLWMTIPSDHLIVPSFKLEAFSWDVLGHISGLASSEFSPGTFTRLAAFFNS
jgi:predicted phosphodiesterase